MFLEMPETRGQSHMSDSSFRSEFSATTPRPLSTYHVSYCKDMCNCNLEDALLQSDLEQMNVELLVGQRAGFSSSLACT